MESRGFSINILIKEWDVLDAPFKVIIKIGHEKQTYQTLPIVMVGIFKDNGDNGEIKLLLRLGFNRISSANCR